MSSRVGLVSQRVDLAVEVATLVAEASSVLVVGESDRRRSSIHLASDNGWERGGADDVDLLIVDAAADPSGILAAAHRGAASGLDLVVVCRGSERDLAAARARHLGAGHVVELPAGSAWLQERLRHEPGGAPLVGVLGAVGGAGATTVAIALAAARRILFVDLDPDGAGIDLPLGLDDVSGIRWEDLPHSARGPLDPESFLTAMPRAGDVPVVCGHVPARAAGTVASVLATARAHIPGAVLDLGRRDRYEVLRADDWLVVVFPATIAGVAGAHRVLERTRSRVVVVVREGGGLPPQTVITELGSPPAVRLPSLRRARELAECGQLLTGGTGRALLRLGTQLHELTS